MSEVLFQFLRIEAHGASAAEDLLAVVARTSNAKVAVIDFHRALREQAEDTKRKIKPNPLISRNQAFEVWGAGPQDHEARNYQQEKDRA